MKGISSKKLCSLMALLILALTLVPRPGVCADQKGVIHLVNGKDLSPFYVFLKDIGRDKDEDKVFSIQDGLLRVSGEHWGCVTTKEEYENYKLDVEFKWGQKTWGNREKAARDNGILVHSIGEDGAYGGIWMYGLEVQLIEGGTGDLLVVGDKSDKFSMTVEASPEKQGDCFVFERGGALQTIDTGRINWWGRDPKWEDVISFRGEKDLERPIGEWNRLEVWCKGDSIEVSLNGVLVNRAVQVKPTRGRIQIQSEGAECFFRKFDLIPLGED